MRQNNSFRWSLYGHFCLQEINAFMMMLASIHNMERGNTQPNQVQCFQLLQSHALGQTLIFVKHERCDLVKEQIRTRCVRL